MGLAISQILDNTRKNLMYDCSQLTTYRPATYLKEGSVTELKCAYGTLKDTGVSVWGDLLCLIRPLKD